MKIILLANHTYAIPVLQYLAAQQLVSAVVMPETIHEGNQQLNYMAQLSRIPVMRFSKQEMQTNFAAWLTMQQPDLVMSYTFSYKLPDEVLRVPKYGVINIHYSLLPKYGGPFPVFWQLKNGEQLGGITIHQMDKDWDSGPILLKQEVAILPEETQGLFSAKLSGLTVSMVEELLIKLKTNQLQAKAQNVQVKTYNARPVMADFKIDWQKQSAIEIINLVNACNPEIGGAVTLFRGQYIKLLEVNKVAVNCAATLAGTIINSDLSNGIIVACTQNEFIRINILRMAEGFFSGTKFALLGVMAGERLS